MECHPHSYGLGLSAFRAAETAVGGFSLLAVLVYVADEHPAFESTARALAMTEAAYLEAKRRMDL
jgi:hypothetical protein